MRTSIAPAAPTARTAPTPAVRATSRGNVTRMDIAGAPAPMFMVTLFGDVFRAWGHGGLVTCIDPTYGENLVYTDVAEAVSAVVAASGL